MRRWVDGLFFHSRCRCRLLLHFNWNWLHYDWLFRPFSIQVQNNPSQQSSYSIGCVVRRPFLNVVISYSHQTWYDIVIIPNICALNNQQLPSTICFFFLLLLDIIVKETGLSFPTLFKSDGILSLWWLKSKLIIITMTTKEMIYLFSLAPGHHFTIHNAFNTIILLIYNCHKRIGRSHVWLCAYVFLFTLILSNCSQAFWFRLYFLWSSTD